MKDKIQTMKNEIKAILDNTSLQFDELGEKFRTTTLIPFCDKYDLSYEIGRFKHQLSGWFDDFDISYDGEFYAKSIMEDFIDTIHNKEKFFNEICKIYDVMNIEVAKDRIKFGDHVGSYIP